MLSWMPSRMEGMVSPPGERTDTVNTSGTFPHSSMTKPSAFSATLTSTGFTAAPPDRLGGSMFP